MKDRMKNLFNFFLRFGLSFGLLWYIFSKIDFSKTVQVVRSADGGYLILALLIYLSVNVFILARWIIFMRAMDLRFRVATVTRYFFIGLFGNLFLPTAIGGDIIKAIGLARETQNKPKVVASIVLDRLSGFGSIAIVAVTTFILGFGYIHDVKLAIPIGIMAVASVAIAFLLFNEKVYMLGCRLFNGFPKLKNALMAMHRDIMMLKDRKKQGFAAVGLGCLAQCIFALTYYFTARALHQDVPLIYFWIFVPILCVAASFPSR